MLTNLNWRSKFNCAARVGSDDLGYGPGSGFSLKPVQTSSAGKIWTNPAIELFWPSGWVTAQKVGLNL